MTGQEGRALIVGEALIDQTRTGTGRAVERHPGGAGANVALALGRLGRQVDLATHLGDDADGESIAGPLHEAGVTVVPIHRNPNHPTFVAQAILDETGSASYRFNIDWDVDLGSVPLDFAVVHTGCLATSLEPGADVVLDYLRRARSTTTVSFDVNARPAANPDIATARRRVEEFIEVSDLVKASTEDIAWLYPQESTEATAQTWADRGATVIVTRGAEGATLYRDGLPLHVPAVRAVVVDTIGAGDAFCAGVLDGLLTLHVVGQSGRRSLAELDDAAWQKVLFSAAFVAAETVSRAGANPPWRQSP